MIIKDGQKIKQYAFIDHCAEGYGYTKPSDDEEFIGRMVYRGDHEDVFIEHRRISDGFTTMTVNPRDVATIEFKE